MEADLPDDTMIDFVARPALSKEALARQRVSLLVFRWISRLLLGPLVVFFVSAGIWALIQGEFWEKWYFWPLIPVVLCIMWCYERLHFCPDCNALIWLRFGKTQPLFCENCTLLLDPARIGDSSGLLLRTVEPIRDKEPILKLIDLVFLLAVKDRSTEVRFEPGREEFRIRYRCDGVLYEMVPPPLFLHKGVSGALRVMAGLKQQSTPQSGTMRIQVDERTEEARIETAPTEFGEDVIVYLPNFGTASNDAVPSAQTNK